jgi:hypothetical protein
MNISYNRQWVLSHYALRAIEHDGRVTGWEAISYDRDGRTIGSRIPGSDRHAVIRSAWRAWGHFNYRHEAEAFAEVFPREK